MKHIFTFYKPNNQAGTRLQNDVVWTFFKMLRSRFNVHTMLFWRCKSAGRKELFSSGRFPFIKKWASGRKYNVSDVTRMRICTNLSGDDDARASSKILNFHVPLKRSSQSQYWVFHRYTDYAIFCLLLIFPPTRVVVFNGNENIYAWYFRQSKKTSPAR